MATEFNNSATWSRYGEVGNHFTQSITFNKSEFTFGKEFYTLKISCRSAEGYHADFISKYYPATANDIPAMFLSGEFTFDDVTNLSFVSSSPYELSTSIKCKRTTSNISNVVDATVNNTYGANVEFNYSMQDGRLLYGSICKDNSIGKIASITIEADFPIFLPSVKNTMGSIPISEDWHNVCHAWDFYGWEDDGTCNTYLTEISNHNFTHISEAVNYYSVTSEIPVNKVWSVRCNLKKNGSFVDGTNKAYDFRILPDARIWFVLTNRINGDDSANMILHINASPWLQKNAYAPDSTYAETSSLDSTYWFGTWQDYDTGDSYTGICSTNIPIFDSDEKGNAYGNGEIGIDEALNGGDTSFSRSTIGDDLSESDIPTVNLAISGCGSYIYALSEAELKEVMGTYLYTTDNALQTHIQDGLWLWGNNPADFIIDCYYIPFSITDFYDTINANLKFGTYQIPDTSYPVLKEANGDRITLFNTTFEGIYGDWRDYTQFDYELYLPFVSGFVKLDAQKYLNKTVKCEMMFDVTTHNLRYYIFADGVITDRVDGSVGINMPLMATDTVNKAKADRNLKYGALTNTISGAASIGLGVTSKDVGGGVSGIVSGISNIINAYKMNEDTKQKAVQSVEGSFSSSMNIYDITYAYLRITERALVIPDKLNTLYGYPSYYMGKASALSGYCEISDVRLVGFTGTIEEANALKNDLKEGVIL